MKGRDFVERLRDSVGASSDSALAEILGITQGRVSQLRAQTTLTPRALANMVARALGNAMRGADLVRLLQIELEASTDKQLAAILGMTQGRVSQLRSKRAITPREVANMVGRTRQTARVGAISPVVERYPIDKERSRGGAGFELFLPGGHPYRTGLRDELRQYHGVYVFYDSRGCSIYVGQASRQKLWAEMKNAFNRSRTKQDVLRVAHPTSRRTFRTSEEKVRQIVRKSVKLHELAASFSAYKVEKALIPEIEALLVRCFANDLLNVKMEKFSTQQRS